MAQLLVRAVENHVKEKLKRRAARHKRSMEAEVREILRSAVAQDEKPEYGLGTEIAALFDRIGFDAKIPKLRIKLRVPDFRR